MDHADCPPKKLIERIDQMNDTEKIELMAQVASNILGRRVDPEDAAKLAAAFVMINVKQDKYLIELVNRFRGEYVQLLFNLTQRFEYKRVKAI